MLRKNYSWPGHLCLPHWLVPATIKHEKSAAESPQGRADCTIVYSYTPNERCMCVCRIASKHVFVLLMRTTAFGRSIRARSNSAAAALSHPHAHRIRYDLWKSADGLADGNFTLFSSTAHDNASIFDFYFSFPFRPNFQFPRSAKYKISKFFIFTAFISSTIYSWLFVLFLWRCALRVSILNVYFAGKIHRDMKSEK